MKKTHGYSDRTSHQTEESPAAVADTKAGAGQVDEAMAWFDELGTDIAKLSGYQRGKILADEIRRLREQEGIASAAFAEVKAELDALVHQARADAMSANIYNRSADDDGCICRGNWRAIVKETEPRIGTKFRTLDGKVFTLAGVMHGSDDYYYVMWSESETRLLSCFGAIERPGTKEKAVMCTGCRYSFSSRAERLAHARKIKCCRVPDEEADQLVMALKEALYHLNMGDAKAANRVIERALAARDAAALSDTHAQNPTHKETHQTE